MRSSKDLVDFGFSTLQDRRLRPAVAFVVLPFAALLIYIFTSANNLLSQSRCGVVIQLVIPCLTDASFITATIMVVENAYHQRRESHSNLRQEVYGEAGTRRGRNQCQKFLARGRAPR